MNKYEKQQSAYDNGLAKGCAMLQGGATVADWRKYWHDSASTLAGFIGYPVDELVEKIVAFHQERLDTVPDLTVYPELRGYRDLLLEEERGMRDVGVEQPLIALSKSLNFWRATRLIQETGKPYYAHSLPEKCRILYLADSDRGALHFKNVDDPLTYWQPKPSIPAGTPWPFSHPLVFDAVGSGLHLDEIPPEIFPVDVQSLCREHCTTVDEAEQFMVHYNYFWSSQNLLIHDYSGNSVALEKTSCRVATRGPNAQGINFVNGMGALDPEISAFQKEQRQTYLDQIGASWEDSADGCYFTLCEGKWKNMARYVDELALNPTWENAKQLMEMRDPSGPMCLTGEKSHPPQTVTGYTLQMRMFELDTRRLHLRQWRESTPVYLDTPEIVQFV